MIYEDDDWSEHATPELRATFKIVEENIPPHDIFKKIVNEIPQKVPDGKDKPGWKYGSFRSSERIGEYDTLDIQRGYSIEDGKIKEISDNIDLSDIKYCVYYRQTCRNKHTDRLQHFVVLVHPEGKQFIPIGTSNEEIENLARKSFLTLQEVVEEYYESENPLETAHKYGSKSIE
jgi:hypothetical protein